MSTFLWSDAARPLRFACTGGAALLLQLYILHALTVARWSPIPADIVAILLSTQLNFVLSYIFTWRDRRPTGHNLPAMVVRWATYQSTAAGAALLNLAVFITAHAEMQSLPA